ncbi:hypothetical protein [Snodgrassella gandavensis]|uniref:hypothetical protein n=1 Tax=Snodgrassella gandavensis TaxID=2946698 RepID=UPI001EF58C3F|nr:hypothetical protein [Snodgrassella gandavensis]
MKMEIIGNCVDGWDLDWYAVFNNNYIAHFTSDGTSAVPEEIRTSKINYDKIFDYFDNLKINSEVDIIENNLPDFTLLNEFFFKNIKDRREGYLRLFVETASKSLFSYNINFETNAYFLVAKPVIPLTLLELPLNVRNIRYKLPEIIQPEALNIS